MRVFRNRLILILVIGVLISFWALFDTAPAFSQTEDCIPGITYTGPAAPDPEWWAAYTQAIASDVASVTAYWKIVYPQLFGDAFPGVCATIEYEPQTVPYAETCNLTTESATANAFYCIPANVIMWDGINFFHPIYKEFGDKANTYIIAHEYSHAAQFLSGSVPPGIRTVATELQADCYAGAYIAYAQQQGALAPGEGREVLSIALALGQSRVGTRWSQRTHGTSTQRAFALSHGFEHGASACQQVTDFGAPGDRERNIAPEGFRERREDRSRSHRSR